MKLNQKAGLCNLRKNGLLMVFVYISSFLEGLYLEPTLVGFYIDPFTVKYTEQLKKPFMVID